MLSRNPIPLGHKPVSLPFIFALLFFIFFEARGYADLSHTSTLTQRVQKLFHRHQLNYQKKNIPHGAVIILDHRTQRILARIGPPEFWRQTRSPGSTLKPFIYGHALEKKLITPDTVLPDSPKLYPGKSPLSPPFWAQNFDAQYEGYMSAHSALTRSHNVPFVELLYRLGVEIFLGNLMSSGLLQLSHDQGEYDLSVAVGGIDIRAEELIKLYMLITPHSRIQLYSPRVTSLIRSALSYPHRRPTYLHSSVFWKNGTSAGHKDAWTVGGNHQYLILVWFGALDKTSVPAISGQAIAEPVFLNLIHALS